MSQMTDDNVKPIPLAGKIAVAAVGVVCAGTVALGMITGFSLAAEILNDLIKEGKSGHVILIVVLVANLIRPQCEGKRICNCN